MDGKLLSSNRRLFLGELITILGASVRPFPLSWLQGRGTPGAPVPEMGRESIDTYDLEAAAALFRDPPDRTRMSVYWIWLGSAANKESVERDLQNMRAAGIGGGVVLPIYPVSLDDPAHGIRNLRFLSPEFMDVLHYAAKRSRELGMTFDLTLGTGWPYGGPSVTPEDAAHEIVMKKLEVIPGTRTIRLPVLGAGEHLVGIFHVTRDGLKGISARAGHGETISVPTATASEGLIAFISTPTGQIVKRAAYGAQGLVLDHLNSAALDRYLENVGEKLWNAVKDVGPHAFWCDSLEVYGIDWTRDFLEQFRERRGYDLLPLLPILFSSISPESNDLRFDFWRTISELAEDGFVKPLQAWSHSKGKPLRMECYNQPPVSLSAFRYVDLPVGEHYEWRMFNACRWTSSGAWLFGRREIGAEAWTWLGIPNRFGDSLEQMKYVSDMHFLSGVNALMSVSYIDDPDHVSLTRWAPYWGPVFNEQQTWWSYFRLLARYVQRVSAVLQEGSPVADLALFLPEEDAMATTEVGSCSIQETTGIRLQPAPESPYHGMNLFFAVRDTLNHHRAPEFGLQNAIEESSPIIESMITNGYSFGGIDAFTLPDLDVEDGRLKAGFADYRVLILPGLKGLRLDSMEKIAEFCRSGGTVIATQRLPEKAYGWKGRNENSVRLKSVVAEIFGPRAGGHEPSKNRFGKGFAIFVNDESENFVRALHDVLSPDVKFNPVDPWVTFVHRRADSRDYYFVCNMGTEPKSISATFSVGHRQPMLWNALTAEVMNPSAYSWNDQGTQVPLDLEPYGSVFVVFTKSSTPPLVTRSNVSDLRMRGHGSVVGTVETDGTYFVGTPKARLTRKVAGIPRRLDVVGIWHLYVHGAKEHQFTMTILRSWTEYESLRYFSGEVSYKTEIEIPAGYCRKDLGLRLDLGVVKETAEVFINNLPAGVQWKRPFRLDITPYVHPGKNTVEVRVTNLLINRLLGMPEPDYSALIAEYGARFPPPQEWETVKEPFPSGLMGPVAIIPYAKLRFSV